MRVLIQAAAARMGGARSHLLGLVPGLAEIAARDDFLLLAQPDLVADLPVLPSNWEAVSERSGGRGALQRLLWEQRRLPALARSWRADVLLSFGSFVPLRPPCATVVEAGNALWFTPQYWSTLAGRSLRERAAGVARWMLFQASLRSATRILVPTRAMRQDLIGFLPDLMGRVDVAWWGVAQAFLERRWEPNQRRTVLGVSKHGINKEFDVLVRSLLHLPREMGDAVVLLTGTPEESEWSRATARLAQRTGLAERVQWLGDVPNVEVPNHMARANVVVLPTWCESFGLPLAEALAMGAPCVAGDIPACREVGGEAALYYHPGNAVALADHVRQVLEAPALACELSEKGRERAKQFQWRANAEQVYATLQKARG